MDTTQETPRLLPCHCWHLTISGLVVACLRLQTQADHRHDWRRNNRRPQKLRQRLCQEPSGMTPFVLGPAKSSDPCTSVHGGICVKGNTRREIKPLMWPSNARANWAKHKFSVKRNSQNESLENQSYLRSFSRHRQAEIYLEREGPSRITWRRTGWFSCLSYSDFF